MDATGNAYVTGATNSYDFPTANPFQATLAGNYDAFVTKFNPAGTALVYSTYLGGSGLEEYNGIAVDAAGNAYVAGLRLPPTSPRRIPSRPIWQRCLLQRLCDEVEPGGHCAGLLHLPRRKRW